MPSRKIGPLPQQGAVLLLIILFIGVSALASSSLLVSHTTQARRDKEEQLLFVGDQFRKAIASYYNTTPPGGARSLPTTLEALLSDERFPTPVRHLRRLYLDPQTGRADWKAITANGRIIGISSSSGVKPLKRSDFPRGYEHFSNAQAYSDWAFVVHQ